MSEIPTKTVPIDSLTPHPENYNQHPESQIAELAESDQSFGQYRNVVVWSPDSEIDLGNGQKLYPDVSYILAGNGYWLGRRRAGRDTIEVKDYTGIPYEDALMLMQIDNAAPLGAQPDPDRLKVLLEKTRERAIDRPKLGAMLARLRESAGVNGNGGEPPKDPGPQVDKAAQLAEKWGTQTGQVWTMGEHRLAVGDCTDKAVVEAVMRGERAEMMFTDPPYGVSVGDKNKFLNSIARSNRIEENLENDTLDEPGLFVLLCESFDNAIEWCLPGAAWYVAAPPGPLHVLFGQVLKDRSIWRQTIQWVKNNATFSPMGVDYHWQAEPIFYGWLPSAGHRYYGGRQQTTVWMIDRPSKSPEHPTMKPVELVGRAINNSSQKGELVYDPFVGSGTTIIAAESLNRKARAIEIDPGYCGVAIERFFQLTGIDPILLSE